MVDFAPVLPPELYPIYDTGRYHLVQAHTIKHNRFIREWFAYRVGRGHVVILDNGTIELGEPDVTSLLRVARAIRPTIIICPDVYCDADKTFSLFMQYLDTCTRYAQGVMIVPHGGSIEEWVECAARMYDYAAVTKPSTKTYLGVPKVLDSFVLNGRLAALIALRHEGYAVIPSMTHLLGVWDYLVGLEPLVTMFPGLMGLDTTLPVARALAPAGKDTGKCTLGREHWKLTEDQIGWIQHRRIKQNIEQVRIMLNQWHRAATAPTAPTSATL